MEIKNEELRQALIKQYSKLSYTSESTLTERIQNIDWWSTEQYRLKIQGNVTKTGSILVSLCGLISFIILLAKGITTIPIVSFIAMFLAVISAHRIESSVSAKARSFELMKLVFEK